MGMQTRMMLPGGLSPVETGQGEAQKMNIWSVFEYQSGVYAEQSRPPNLSC